MEARSYQHAGGWLTETEVGVLVAIYLGGWRSAREVSALVGCARKHVATIVRRHPSFFRIRTREGIRKGSGRVPHEYTLTARGAVCVLALAGSL